ncbi:MAG: DciA family protein [Candidatus Omnitrophica bacterium]|nr:DciA family protein [Candidatus Omnitrophota bacterium]
MKKKPERIDGVIKSLIEKLDKEARPTSEGIETIWQEIAGDKAAKHAKPVSLRKKRLVINVDGSSWLYELTLKKGVLLGGLKKKLGEDKITELQFRIGEL